LDLSTNDARLALARKWAPKYGLDPYLVCAVIEQESGWNPWAVRFEPGFLARYVKPINPLLPTTQEITRACSFGLMQVMGEVALECGWVLKFFTELCDPDTGVDYGCRKLQKCFMEHVTAEPSLQAYNGGGNPNYGAQVLARMAKYEPQVEGVSE
jgi:soluble lytic murein transglycosylase-like protein